MPNTDDTSTSFITPEHRQDVSNALIQEVMPYLKRQARLLAVNFAREWDTNDADLIQLWITQVLREGVDVMREWQAGECEANGHTLRAISDATEVGSASNVRRRMPASRQFAEARRAVDLTGAVVPVKSKSFKVEVMPVSDEDEA